MTGVGPPDGARGARRVSAPEPAAAAREVLATHWGRSGVIESLPGEADLNFRIRPPAGPSLVLKVSHPGTDPRAIELERVLLERIEGIPEDRRPPLPRLVPTVGGETAIPVDWPDGSTRYARVLTWVSGRTLATARPAPPGTFRGLGSVLGQLATAVGGLDHPARDLDRLWDPMVSATRTRERLVHVDDPARRALLERLLAAHAPTLETVGGELPRGFIHGDANDWNVIVEPTGAGGPWGPIRGLVDLGDALHTARVGDVAIACAYGLLEEAEPLAVASELTAGFHSEAELLDVEFEALWPLTLLRLCASVSISAERAREAGANPYLAVSEAPAWDALERLEGVPAELALAALRSACRKDPWPRGSEVVSWLGSQTRVRSWVAPDDLVRIVHRPGVARLDTGRQAESGSASPGTVQLGVSVELKPGAELRSGFRATVAAEPEDGLVLTVDPPGAPSFLVRLAGVDAVEGMAVGESVEPGDTVARSRPDALARIGIDTSGRAAWTPPRYAAVPQREAWLSISPDPWQLLGVEGPLEVPPPPPVASLTARRREHLPSMLSVSYRRPLHIELGMGAHLFSADGRRYLDCVNNVAHVGHEHPAVVSAGAEQMRRLNTNTRYLHPLLLDYAERLAATLPDPLDVVFLVCSGSEANELALRLARAATGGSGIVVLDGAYHGNTHQLVGISPYKFDGPGGEGAPPQVRVAPMPDDYRGPYRRDDQERGTRYGEAVGAAFGRLRDTGIQPAAFIYESILSCGGQIDPPRGFLPTAHAATVEAGAVTIADEVQIGFGRVGSHFWGFERQGVVPDIVTMGKPIGNGHPMGAVVTTREVADAFDTGMEYFNTFGGNPVSCAIGLAVLDVIEAEGLQERAERVGARLRTGLEELADRHELIGDVRGAGLFLGIEFVRDRGTLEPAPDAATRVVNAARDLGVLLSTDGPLHNVIKIKPPLVFSEENADRLVRTLDLVLHRVRCG